MMDTSALSCSVCGKTYTGDSAPKQLRMHELGAHKRTKTEKTDMSQTTNEKQKEAGAAEKPNLNPNLTADERAIVERVMDQDQSDLSWMTVTEDEMEDYSLQRDPMELPPPAKKAQEEQRYAFHWAKLHADRIDQMTKQARPPYQWALCTRSTTPWLAKWVNDAYGCVTRHDCALMMKPWHHHMMVRQAKEELNKAYEDGSGIQGRKNKIAERDGDVEAYAGKKFAIGKGDEVLADESYIDGSEGNGELAAAGEA
jgi:hypothetical protein